MPSWEKLAAFAFHMLHTHTYLRAFALALPFALNVPLLTS
jgi:hypothetical protein